MFGNYPSFSFLVSTWLLSQIVVPMAQRMQPNTDKLYIPNKGFFSELFLQLPLPDPMKLLIQALVVACLAGFVLGTGWLTTLAKAGPEKLEIDVAYRTMGPYGSWSLLKWSL